MNRLLIISTTSENWETFVKNWFLNNSAHCIDALSVDTINNDCIKPKTVIFCKYTISKEIAEKLSNHNPKRLLIGNNSRESDYFIKMQELLTDDNTKFNLFRQLENIWRISSEKPIQLPEL